MTQFEPEPEKTPGSEFLISRNVVNMWNAPGRSSELVSQAVLGDVVRGVDQAWLGPGGEPVEPPFPAAKEYRLIQTADRYEGWVNVEATVDVWDRSDFLSTSIATLFADVYEAPDPKSEILTKLVVSSRVSLAHGPGVADFVPLLLPDKKIGYVHDLCLDITHDSADESGELADQRVRRSIDIGSLKRQIMRAVGSRAVDVGRRLIGTPYLWGGCTPFGIDCSGFVQLCFRLSGLQLLRDAELQFHDRRFERCDMGQSLDESDLLAGDLVAFQRESAQKVTHIGIAMGDGRFIHSSSGQGVNIERCNSERYASVYVGAVRLSANADLAIEAA